LDAALPPTALGAGLAEGAACGRSAMACNLAG
jgi:hypothetical protein